MTYLLSFLAIFLDNIRITNNKQELAEAIAPITAIILSPVNGLSQLILIKLKRHKLRARNIKIGSTIFMSLKFRLVARYWL